MSKEAREWTWEYSVSRGTARLVLLSLADRAPDEQCVVWASLASLMKRTNASRNAVRSALTALADSGEVKVLTAFEGPQRSTVYRLPRAAAWLAKATAARRDAPDAYVEPPALSDLVPELDEGRLRKHGIWPKQESEFAPRRQHPTGSDPAPTGQKVPPRGVGNRPPGGSGTDPQNRSEPKVNRNSSSTSVMPANDWRLDPDTHTWARQNGHLDRLGEDGLAAADAKWRAHRSPWTPRSATAWAADWRAWIAREHSPTGPISSSGPGTGSGTRKATRADAHLAALLAALDETTGRE
ncbi:helix-turn-helix domain-containing protein [Actinacidiphila sp. bgisy144]|uniref:helix-turn-helix domain-containing protein n=1 Tax=Actinacidiphila sp. bgisy144 TaxID=3413791 RepID=UPI003EBF3C2B